LLFNFFILIFYQCAGVTLISLTVGLVVAVVGTVTII
jgi:hypothetical protein